GGSNDIANLYPEKLSAHPGYRVKDKLENRLHKLVCAGTMTLQTAQSGIASDWQALYERVVGSPPAGCCSTGRQLGPRVGPDDAYSSSLRESNKWTRFTDQP